ncbi:MAG TPA: cation-translocating P-type ATPase [Actinocrinis sp.]|nr:cation-translocating P-type ATPase [Actinocrinis sp.]
MLLKLNRIPAHAVRTAAAATLGTTRSLATATGSLAGSLASPLVDRAGAQAAQVARLGRIPRGVAEAVHGLSDVGPHRTKRRTWARDGRAHIEVKGLTGQGGQHRRLSAGVTAALTEIKGVHWAEINAVTQHVLISFDEDEVDLGLLIECVESIEEEHGTAEETFSRAEPEHPSADGPATMAAITLAADLVGLGVAFAGQAMQVRPLPAGARIPLMFAETYPRVRHTLERQLGRTHTDLMLAVSTSALHALSQGPTPLAVDSVHHFLKLVEVRSRQAVWHKRERELVADGRGLPEETHERVPRPVPFPEGPIERLGDRTAVAALLGAGGMLAFTRDPGRAAELMLATMPKAARQGREAYASALGWELARRGVVPMDASALRRLDRVSVIVIESTVLCSARPRILSAAAIGTGLDDAKVWQIAERVLADLDPGRIGHVPSQPAKPQAEAAAAADRPAGVTEPVGAADSPDPTQPAGIPGLPGAAAAGPSDPKLTTVDELAWLRGPGPWTSGKWRLARAADAAPGEVDGPIALTLDLTDGAGRRRGRIRIGCAPHPLADVLLDAARGAVDRVVITEHESASELLPWADEVIPAGEHVADHIRRMQSEDESVGVLLLSTDHDAALHAADVGIAVLGASGAVSWSADLICGPGLAEAWRLLHAVGVARQVSERSTRLALGGSALGALLTIAGSRGQGADSAEPAGGPRRGLAPVHSASMAAVATGAFGAYRISRMRVPHPAVRGNWHALAAQEAFVQLRAARKAEDETQVASPGQFASLVHVGRDTVSSLADVPLVSKLVVTPSRGATALAHAVAEELRDPLTPVLAFGAAASAVVGSGVDALLVGGVMAGNAVISGGQRLRAERALNGLLMGEQQHARVVDWSVKLLIDESAVGAAGAAGAVGAAGPFGKRGVSARGAVDELGYEESDAAGPWLAGLTTAPTRLISAALLRPGDVITLRAADVVPADVRLISADGLEVDESSLTGESLPVAKSVAATPGAELADRSCMLYEGCTVLAGTAFAVVAAVGQATEAGRAAAAAGDATGPAGMQARLAELTKITLPVAGLGGLAVTGLAAMRGAPLRQAVASGVAIAVAAVPEGLPLVATVAQLAAARRLSRHGILVRSSRTLEALGRVDTLCFDKTGTLTEGKLKVTRLASLDGEVGLSGVVGERLLRTAARACPQPDVASGRPVAHATDGAVLEAAQTNNTPDTAWQLVAELPFESNRGYSASLGTDSGRLQLAVKGAPEVMLSACTTVLSRPAGKNGSKADGEVPGPVALTPARRRAALDAIAGLAGTGLRVLAIAEANPEAESLPQLGGGGGRGAAGAVGAAGKSGVLAGVEAGAVDLAPMVKGLTLVGFVAIADTPRATAAAAIRRLNGAGVRITMITGDHPTTASAIAEQLGIVDPHKVLTGAQLDALPKKARAARIAETSVFARVSPEQKVRIVQVLQQAGHVVAMTGDGTNDAAAIRLADVGIAMAGRGSVSARNAADLVLADPDPTRIVDALLEGRALWGSVRDAVSILVGGNAGEIGFTVLGTAISGRAPLATRQLLLVNMLTDMLPALAVALAPAKPGAQGEDAAAAGDPLAAGPVAGLWGPALARDLAVRGTATAVGATLAWQTGRMTGRARRADTMGLGALVGTQLGQTLVTGWHSPLVIATGVASAAALVAIVETPGVSQFFGCTPLGPVGWAVVAGSSAAATLGAVVAPRVLDRMGVGVGEAA